MNKVRNSDSHPIYLNYVDYKWTANENNLAITLAPGKYQPISLTGSWERDLQKDLNRIRNQYKMETLVSLLEVKEAAILRIPHQLEEADKLGMTTFNFPVVDGSIPDKKEEYKKGVMEVVDQHLKKGRNVVVHCMGGLGRAPTFTAACLIYAGVGADDAIQIVQKARPDSLTLKSQREYLRDLKFPLING